VHHHDNRRGDRGVVHIRRQLVNKRAVDLQPIDAEALEVVQRRISGAEVVYRYAYAHRPQLAQHQRRGVRVVYRSPFGDLELEVARVELRVTQHTINHLDEVRLLELQSGEVDVNDDRWQAVVLPRLALPARFPHHPLADRHDEPRVLRDGDELGGM